MLIAFAGRPGSGKSTIARRLAAHLSATWLRIDTIEQALRACATLPEGVVTEGYAVAYRLADDNLRTGATVIADSVNPLAITRDAWIAVAHQAGVPIIEVEIICSDPRQHRRRVETRPAEIPGLILPSWDGIHARAYDAWDRPHIVLDTASKSPEASLQELLDAMRNPPILGASPRSVGTA